jgi:DNA-binding MarR family transcriptional regulator
VQRELLAEGLIERRRSDYHRTAKPYFITPAGREYLENSPPEMKEKLAALDRKESWVGKVSDNRLESIVLGVIRGLPEFQDAPSRSIDVAQAITEAINREAEHSR